MYTTTLVYIYKTAVLESPPLGVHESLFVGMEYKLYKGDIMRGSWKCLSPGRGL